MSLTLGVHIGHDGGAALVKDGTVLFACSEERLTRFKYANGWWNALRYCLDAADKSIDDLDLVVFSNAGNPLPDDFDGGVSRWGRSRLHTCVVDHHLSHAIGAFSFSGFPKALAYVADAGGNGGVTESAYVFDSDRYVEVMRSPTSRLRCKGLGNTFEAFTNFLGFTDQESGKTMALAAFGEPYSWGSELIKVGAEGQIASGLEMPHQWGVVQWLRDTGRETGPLFPDSRTNSAKNIAASVQCSLEDALSESLSCLLRANDISAVALSGGVGLNCAANSLLRRGLQTDFSFFPICSDAGLPLGNALYGQLITDGKLPILSGTPIFWGREYDESEVAHALHRHPDTVPPGGLRFGDLTYQKSSSIVKEVAQRICAGQVVGWFQGRSEFGPRALGGRSILANPRCSGIRDKINTTIKQREWFRPFGPSILADDIGLYIEEARAYPYMIEAPLTSALGFQALGDCVHIDKSARVQSVDSSALLYYDLLKQMKSLTGHGILLNTSFNILGPIVETPGDAIATFLRSDMDALAIGEFICTRHSS